DLDLGRERGGEAHDPHVGGDSARKLAERALPVEATRDQCGDLLLARLLDVGELAIGPKRIRNLLRALFLGLDLCELPSLAIARVASQDERQDAHQRGAERAENDVHANAGGGRPADAGGPAALFRGYQVYWSHAGTSS